ncbi:hypothetical protein SLS60_000106 [Paraconiothyrium brasiliense]|uniref:Uncharacterized protein n=1 Tax=Paraconiothyrium brasiliense TaxID=300254 RepID=A0ABR3S5B8_9PLEO
MPLVRRKDDIERPNAYGGSGRYPALPFESGNKRHNDQVLRRNAVRLFARDFDFHDDAVWACLRRDNDIVSQFGDVDINAKLAKLKIELQQDMLGSVFDHARNHDETHTDDAKLKDKPENERDAVWDTAFNDVIFWIMVDPLRQGIKVDRFRDIKEWKEMYHAMFIAAADTIYMSRLGGPLPVYKAADMQKVYRAVRSVINDKFPHRPKFDTIPSQPVGAWDMSHRKTRIRMQASRGGSEWANAIFSATLKEVRAKTKRDLVAARSAQP